MSNEILSVTPADALIDEPRAIRVEGLAPAQRITIQAQTERAGSVMWRSQAEFVADAQGVVDLSSQAPLTGSYEGVSPMGLLWSQVPEKEGQREMFANTVSQPLVTTISALTSTQTLTATLTQHLMADGVQRIEVREDGLVGTLFLPATPGPHPAVMILNGSGGGINEPRGALYASRGYIAFALGYFKAPGLSDYISNTPLEYFKKGLDWLRRTQQPLGGFVALSGQSRGGELVLLLGSIYPQDVSAVVAYVPGAVVHSGQNAADPQVGREGPAWLLDGKPLTHVWQDNKTATWAPFDEGPSPHRHARAIMTALQDSDAVARARIEVEKIQGPVILLSATDDGAWPSSLYSKMVYDHLHEVGFAHVVQWVDTQDGGHSIVFPYVPTTQLVYAHPVSGKINTGGGTPTANAQSDEHTWAAVKDFLRNAVRAHLAREQ
ncbi:palmitoyl-CoA hydrolase [Advenella kashmirensis W13003]|uniref:Palmitoyl-CoA hydrolase n=1 Tax=Advenella kashmirensis W13003 TaxID=1424334 RepID=V8QTZ7_9BURK|nr:acyl-CoA thioesterase/bile acid-CoA:amino acid N-acyltransferase family protein [Advenella kashmirensis]ETF02823.1 palmitoyl-CoA hydrolase [Advenella kashmirensis W13003]